MRTGLVIDDDLVTLECYAAVLKCSGFDVLTADCGRSGLRQALTREFDFIILDCRLPDMPGLEILRRLRDASVSAAVVIVTGYGGVASAVEAIQNGAMDYVEKPVFADALVRVIEHAIAARSAPGDVESTSEEAPIEAHAASRWARRLVVPVIDSAKDIKTVREWARHIAVSTGALKNWCRTANLSPRRSLVLARLLRALRLHQTKGFRPQDSLDVVDRRTLVKLLRLGGLSLDMFGERWSDIDQFLAKQMCVTDTIAIRELKVTLKSRLHSRGLPAEGTAARVTDRAVDTRTRRG